MKRKFKSLIFDLDGTAIANRQEALPTNAVIKAVSKAQEVITVSAATGRPITNAREIIRKLNLKDPCIVSGGAIILDPKTEEIIWEKLLAEDQVKQIVDVTKNYPYVVLFSNELLGEEKDVNASEKAVKGPEHAVYIMKVKNEDRLHFLHRLNSLENIIAHYVPSWTKGHIDIHITHKEATKKHALEVLVAKLGVEKEEVIAVGDSNNDKPLFEVAGFKVAMGNGTTDLKELADFIAPSVEKDGLALVIEKFIL